MALIFMFQNYSKLSKRLKIENSSEKRSFLYLPTETMMIVSSKKNVLPLTVSFIF